jgi:hypothetical protein
LQPQTVAAELPREQVHFVLSRFEDFDYPDRAYEFVNAEFSLPFISAAAFPSVFSQADGLGEDRRPLHRTTFGPNDNWNPPESVMNFHSQSDVEWLLRGWAVLELTEEDCPGQCVRPMTRLLSASKSTTFPTLPLRSPGVPCRVRRPIPSIAPPAPTRILPLSGRLRDRASVTRI